MTDLFRCIRAGYCHITPQACLERHFKSPDLCKLKSPDPDNKHPCTKHIDALRDMSEVSKIAPDVLIERALDGTLALVANPFVNPTAAPTVSLAATMGEEDDDGAKKKERRKTGTKKGSRKPTTRVNPKGKGA